MRSDHSMRHGGNISVLAAQAGLRPDQIIDFSASINPLGFPEWLRPLISSRLEDIVNYPHPRAEELVNAACVRYGSRPEEVLTGNGTAELISLLPGSLHYRQALIPIPAYTDYEKSCLAAGVDVEHFKLNPDTGFQLDPDELAPQLGKAKLVFICRPNNPTGIDCSGHRLRLLARRFPECLFVVDEAFGDFVEDFDSLSFDRPDNVLVLLSLTKMFAFPGLRVGIALADPEVARSIASRQPDWSVNTLAQAAGAKALLDEEFVLRTRKYIARVREELKNSLAELSGIKVYPGRANFLLLRLNHPTLDAPGLARELLRRHGLAVRVCGNFQGLDNSYLRAAVRGPDENSLLVRAMQRILSGGDSFPVRSGQKRKPAIMFQGTGSNAGKSILTAAMCRILLQDGYQPAPFKAQNMSLNSYVTKEGEEMGRAQVVQAQAARLEPDVRMNPVLLKPGSETGCQVIINGRPVADMDASKYVNYKSHAFAAARKAFRSLADEYDVLVLEGAGSPAEINLKSHDIVNMAMAKYAEAPVLLVGDIDRGGVFASFVGTMEVLAEWERKLIRGFVINKFRGDPSLLMSAFELTRMHTNRQIFGVIPFMHDLELPDEDSVSWKEGVTVKLNNEEECVVIGVADVPHISNFTDFDALSLEPDVRLKIVRTPDELNKLDALILPGSKNVIKDFKWLQQNGLLSGILQMAAARKAEIIGICGGMQMLGRMIADPYAVESKEQGTDCAGLLELTTELERKKTLCRVSATHLASGLEVSGYEIHHGKSRISGSPLLRLADGKYEGVRSSNKLVWGTYLHGIFDADEFRRWFIDQLRLKKGLRPVNKILYAHNPEQALDRLADKVRECLDIKRIYKWMGL